MKNHNDLNIALIQTEIVWEDFSANIEQFKTKINTLTADIDIIVLPEMFTTGFTMRPQIFPDSMKEDTISFLMECAQNTGSAICGSFLAKDNNQYYNRFIWVEPNGNIYTYDKAHLFRMGEEQLHYQKGNQRIIIEYKGWRIAPFVCYDLRFPVWIRKSSSFDYDLLIFVANWPEKRKSHWKTLTMARAIENQSYVVAANRIGNDGNGVYHSGDSCVINPLGEILYAIEHESEIKVLTISLEVLQKYKENFPVGLDADKFEII